jgi:hypothetical protein
MNNNHFWPMSHVLVVRVAVLCLSLRALRATTQWLDYQEEAKEMDITIETDSELRLGSLAEYDPSLGMGRLPQDAAFRHRPRSIK